MTLPDADHPHHYLVSYTYVLAVGGQAWSHQEVALPGPWSWGRTDAVVAGLRAPGISQGFPAIVSVLKLSDPPVRVES